MSSQKDLSAEAKISKMFTVARAIAILSVVSAHITIKSTPTFAALYSTIGSIGVVLFFIVAGYYYKRYSPATLLKKKLTSVVLPWLVLGTLVWIGNTFLLHSEFTISSYIKWMIGYNTYLYFVLVLLVCFVLFYINNPITCWVAICLNAVSITLTSMGYMEPIISKLHITNYLNIFNWIGFFAIGMLLRRVPVDKLYNFIRKTRLIWIAVSLFATIFLALTKYKVGYFSAMGWLYELVSVMSIVSLCTFNVMYNKITVSISELSYSIYLLHLMFTGILAKIYGVHAIMYLFANLIVVGFTWVLLLLGKWIAYKIKLGKIYCYVVGIRHREN